MIILGAGMGGCIAALLNAKATILEASPTPPLNHNAVLRFRSDVISNQFGIPFKKVTVNKAIFFDGKLHTKATPLTANLYSRKVTGKILGRSIWNLDSVERYIAPLDFHHRMIELIGNRITYCAKVDAISAQAISTTDGKYLSRDGRSVVSTMPMPLLAKATGVPLDATLFKRQAITTARCQILDCDVNQTVYFPDMDTLLYRATITGSELILEFTGDQGGSWFDDSNDIEKYILPAFGLTEDDLGPFTFGTQQYGKIAPVDSGILKAFMFEATRQLNVFSLGRFAIWRNVLLDDVFSDVFAIRRMLEQSHYDIRKEIQ